MKGKYILSLIVVISILVDSAMAAESIGYRTNPYNPHIKRIRYQKDYPYEHVGYYGVATIIKFEDGEKVHDIIMGDASGWQVHDLGGKILLKPIQDEAIAETNATIFTSIGIGTRRVEREYLFKMSAKEPESGRDKNIPYEIRFVYSKENAGTSAKLDDISKSMIDSTSSSVDSQDTLIGNITNAEHLNFEYRIGGSKGDFRPVKVFDDGQFTYFQFPKKNGTVPAIFYTDSLGYEGMVNYKVKGDYIVVEQRSARFTLRNGEDFVCVLNKEMKYYKMEEEGKRKSIVSKHKTLQQ